MKKKLFRQMLNEWQSNLWIVIEFIIVSVVLWFICDYFSSAYCIYNNPRGFDISHCYLLDLYEITDKSPEFVEGRTPEQMIEDKLEILERLKRRPEVEAASYSNNSYPYNGSNNGITFRYDSVLTEGLARMVTPDFMRVFRYRGINGESSEQLAKELEEGKMILSENFFSYENNKIKGVSKLIADSIKLTENEHLNIPFGTPIVPVRYDDYNLWSQTAVFSNSFSGPEALLWMNELCIRVREDMDKDIIENLMKDAQSQFHVGNYILSNVESFDTVREAFHLEDNNKQRNYIAGMIFLLINIFLGLLGTFWFRTQQRVQEVALRKVNGATSRSVFGRLISEGLIMLAIATPIAFGIDCLLAYFELNSRYYDYLEWNRMIVCALIAAALMALMIVAGIWFPARKAMKIEPAIALKDE